MLKVKLAEAGTAKMKRPGSQVWLEGTGQHMVLFMKHINWLCRSNRFATGVFKYKHSMLFVFR